MEVLFRNLFLKYGIHDTLIFIDEELNDIQIARFNGVDTVMYFPKYEDDGVGADSNYEFCQSRSSTRLDELLFFLKYKQSNFDLFMLELKENMKKINKKQYSTIVIKTNNISVDYVNKILDRDYPLIKIELDNASVDHLLSERTYLQINID